MLLIGSRATKHHFPFYRKPKDYDFIASEIEVRDFLAPLKYEDRSTHSKKVKAMVQLDKPTYFEFELIEQIPSSLALWNIANPYCNDHKLDIIYRVASPEYLFLLKKSHICFNIHFKKNIIDYLYLKDRADPSKFNSQWQGIFHTRFNEIKERVKYKERNFDIANEKFFEVSEKMVNRMLPHDNIHFATCFFDRPLFMEVKDDLSKAAMNENKVNALPFDLKIKLIQEECMALSIERYILPSIRKKKIFDARQAYVDTACKMVYNYLPMFLRFFAADNFLQILDLQVDYVAKFFQNVKGLELTHEDIPSP